MEWVPLQRTTVKIHIQPDARPRFFFAPDQFRMHFREKVTAELERLCKADVIEPVQFSEWAATDCSCAQKRRLHQDLRRLQANH